MYEEAWNSDSARQALLLLREAHDGWTELLSTAHNPASDLDPERTLRTMHQHAASVLMWARGLDDMAGGANGLAGYPDTATAPNELVDAAVYACARAIHQLIQIGRFKPGGRAFPVVFPLTFKPAALMWVEEGALPPPEIDNGPIRSRRRRAYLNRWAGRPMADGLAEVRAYMDAHIAAAVGVDRLQP